VLVRRGKEPRGLALVLGEGHGAMLAQKMRKGIAAERAARDPRASGRPAAAPTKPLPSSVPLGNGPRLSHQRARITDSARTVTLADAAPGIHRAERTPDDLAPLEPGQARVRVLRAGFSPADDKPQSHYGQLLRMPIQAALRAEGAIEIIERFGDPALNAAAPGTGASLSSNEVQQ
jgi:hypothetical protein